LLSSQLFELGKGMVSTVENGRLIYPETAYDPSGVGVWGVVVCALKYAPTQVCLFMYIRAYMYCHLAIGE